MRNRNYFIKKKKGVTILAAIAIAAGAFAAPAAAEINLRVVHLSYLPLSSYDNTQVSGFNAELMAKIAETDSELSIAETEGSFDLYDAVLMSTWDENSVGVVLPVDKWGYKDWGYETEPDVYKRHPYLNSVPVILASTESDNPDSPLSGINGLEDLDGKNVVCSKYSLDEIKENIDAYNSTHTDNPLNFNLMEIATPFTDYETYWYSLLVNLNITNDSVASAALMPLQSAVYYVKNEPDKFKIIEIPDADQLFVYSYWIDYRVENPSYNPEGVAAMATAMERIDADIDALVADGTYAELCEEYLGVDLTPYYGLVESQSEDTGSEAEQIEGTDAVDEAAVQAEEVPAEETAATVYTDTETVIKVQEALNAAGYDCGVADGIAGNNTNQAIINFKAANGLDESSDITDALLTALGIN